LPLAGTNLARSSEMGSRPQQQGPKIDVSSNLVYYSQRVPCAAASG
jgi:hypothetical protein